MSFAEQDQNRGEQLAASPDIEKTPAMTPEPPRARPMKKPGSTIATSTTRNPKGVRSKAKLTPQTAMMTRSRPIVN